MILVLGFFYLDNFFWKVLKVNATLMSFPSRLNLGLFSFSLCSLFGQHQFVPDPRFHSRKREEKHGDTKVRAETEREEPEDGHGHLEES